MFLFAVVIAHSFIRQLKISVGNCYQLRIQEDMMVLIWRKSNSKICHQSFIAYLIQGNIIELLLPIKYLASKLFSREINSRSRHVMFVI